MYRRWIAPLVALVVLLCPAVAGAEALPSWPDGGLPVFGQAGGGARVDALARAGNMLYVGGEFDYVGPRNQGPLMRLDADGHADPSFPQVASDGWWPATVDAIEPDGSGGWYVGGRFSTVGGVARRNLAHVEADGTVDPSFDPSPDGRVTTVLRDGGALYVAGNFANVGGAARARLAALDSAGAATSWDPEPDARVRALATDGTTLYVGGDFATIGGQPRSDLAAFATADGTLTDFAPTLDGNVTALAADATRVYATGGFTNHLAAFTTADATPDSGWSATADSAARQIVDVGDRIEVLSSKEQTIAGHTGYGAALDPATGAYLADGPTGGEAGVATRDGALASGQGADGSEGILEGGAFLAPGLNLSDVTAVAPAGSGALVAGRWRSLGGERRENLAAIDLATGDVTGWDPGPATVGPVHALALAGDDVLAGGAHVVALDTTTAAEQWDLTADGDVRALAVDGTTAYAGGAFTTLGGTPRAHLAALDTAHGTLTHWDPGADNAVDALALDSGEILAGGDFTTLGGESRDHLGALGASGAPTGWAPAPSGAVHALAVDDGVAYAGGAFGAAAVDRASGETTPWDVGTAVDAIAAWRGHVWLAGDGGLDPRNADGSRAGYVWAPDSAAALLPAGSSLLAGGGRGVASFSYAPVYDASPSISGTLAAGETLACEPGAWREDTLSQTWSWWRNGAQIDGTTSPTYVATADDVGQTITCRETRHNLGGSVTAESPPAGVALPADTAPPTLTSTPVYATAVTCDPGTWTGAPDGYDFQWLRDGDPIAGADASTYTVRNADIAHTLSCRVWARVGGARVRADSAGAVVPTPPARIAPPTLSGSSASAGEAHVGDTLACAPGTWSGDAITYTYRWLYLWDSGAPEEADGASHTVAAADLGHLLACQVTATNAGGSRHATASVWVVAAPPANTAAPVVAGTARVGATLTCSTGTWTNSPSGFHVRWFSDGRQVATGSSFALTDAYQGHRVSCDVAADWSGGTTAPVASAAVTVPYEAPVAVVAPAIYGDPEPGGTLTCATGDWRHAATFAVAWLRDGAPVPGGDVYAVTAADAGHGLSCRVTASGPGGSVVAASGAVAVVAAAGTPGEITGGAGNDRLTGGAATDRLDGGAGNDRLAGGSGADSLLGGSGADWLLGGAGNDRLTGGTGGDRLDGGRGGDGLEGGTGNDRLTGGPGRDRLDGGTGNDFLDARDGHGGDFVRCGRGRDHALVDRGDRTSRDCESVRRRTSPKVQR